MIKNIFNRELAEGQVIDFVTNIIKKETGKSGLNIYVPRAYQKWIADEVVTAVKSGDKIIGCELAARFGKTLWALDVFQQLSKEGKQYMILPAYVLTACSSFRKEVASFEDFQDVVFINYDDADFQEQVEANVDKKLVITASLHVDADSTKYGVITNLDDSKKVAFVDEADFGAHTESSRAVLDKLSCSTTILMTGTAIERALAGYDVDKIVKWSYFDMLLLKDGYHPRLDTVEDKQAAIDSCAEIVRPKMFKMCMPEAATLQETLPDFLQTKWGKLLEDVDLAKFTLSTVIKAMFTGQVDEAQLYALSLESVTPANVTMIFGAFKNKLQHGKFVKLVKSTLGDDFVVIKVNGDETSNSKAEKAVKAKVANAKLKGKRVIIVSKDMASRSFSIPEIDTVFLMYDGGLLSQTVQKTSRAFTPGKTYDGEAKVEGTIVSLSLDANREEIDPVDLYVVAEANRINDGNESIQDSIRRVLKSAPIFQNDLALGAIQIDADEYSAELLKQSSVVKEAIASISVENIDPSDFVDALLANRQSAQTKRDDSLTNVKVSDVRTAIVDRKVAEREGITKDEEKQFIKNVIFFTSNITALTEIVNYQTDELIDTLKTITEQKLEADVEEFYGLTFESIKVLVDNGSVPVRLLNTLLQNHQIEELSF